jgi:magnesium transporter
MVQERLTPDELFEAWAALSDAERVEGFTLLAREDAEELVDQLDARQQADLLLAIPTNHRRLWMRYLDPDDAADVIQEAPNDQREGLLELVDAPTRKEISALLAYDEDEAGGLMNPRYARLRPDMSVDEAIAYLRRQSSANIDSIYYGYVLDPTQKLLGTVSLRELVTAPPTKHVRDLMETDLVTVQQETHQEEVGNLFAQHDLMAIPVVDEHGCMKGIVTVDDIVDVFREEATEDIQKIGGTEALDAPYLEVRLPELLAKRLGWLAGLLLLGVCTVFAMSYFEAQLAQMTALALFVPMIIASGGNSGTQAATLVVRAMALEEVRLHDWGRVVRRELAVGLGLGVSLGILGMAVVLTWHWIASATGRPGFGSSYLTFGAAVSISVLAVALWGTICGSMLPFLLRGVGLDPASASAPLVATIVDATGLILYFSISVTMLRGSFS